MRISFVGMQQQQTLKFSFNFHLTYGQLNELVRSSPECELAEYLLLLGSCFSDSSFCAEHEAASPSVTTGEAALFVVLESHCGIAL